jgi:hypothetical protein
MFGNHDVREFSFSLLTYMHMQRKHTSHGLCYLQSGFNKGDGVESVMLPEQGTGLASNSNVGITGRYMYEVAGKPQGPADACSAEY